MSRLPLMPSMGYSSARSLKLIGFGPGPFAKGTPLKPAAASRSEKNSTLPEGVRSGWSRYFS